MLFVSWLLNWQTATRAAQNSRKASGRRERMRRATSEQLESRELLTLTASFTAGVLSVSSNNTGMISIDESPTVPGQVRVQSANGDVASLLGVAAANVTSITVSLGDANNSVDLTGLTPAVFSTLTAITVTTGEGDDRVTGPANFGISVIAGEGNDTIVGGSLADRINGGDGSDSITGGAGADTLLGLGGADTIFGQDGGDSLDGGSGADLLDAGSGNDVVIGGSENDTLDGGDGDDILQADAGNDRVFGQAGSDVVTGGSGRDTIDGGSGNDDLTGDSDDDSILGQTGDDTLNGGLGNDTIVGSDGNDSAVGGGGHDAMFGDSQDSIVVGSGNDILRGSAGNDSINGGGGQDEFYGDNGDDRLLSGDVDTTVIPGVRVVGNGVTEPVSGLGTLTFTITLAHAAAAPVTVAFQTANGTATALDFVARSGAVVFPVGTTTQTVAVSILSDLLTEGAETFFLNLTSATNGVLKESQAVGVIVDELAPAFVAVGPQTITGGQIENVTPDNAVAGAIHALVVHPTNPEILYVGAVNGGVWRTDNATAVVPSWRPLTDNEASLSIGALTLDAAAPDRVLAGIGRTSSFGGLGGALAGLLLSENGGSTWRSLAALPSTAGSITGLSLSGDRILVSGLGGVFVSDDGGDSFSDLTSDGELPVAEYRDLVGDPTNANRFYVSASIAGVFRTDDGGVNWVNISDNDVSLDGLPLILSDGFGENVEMAIGQDGRLYVAATEFGQLGYIGFTSDQGASWTSMDLPQTPEFDGGITLGLHPRRRPGGQGNLHLSIAVDPTNSSIVYLGGDRQDGALFTEAGNFIGARNFSGRLFRGDATVSATGAVPSPQWAHLTHSNAIAATPTGGTANSSAPHADSRDIAFDLNGNLIEVDDGGIYRRSSPRDNTGVWTAIVGNLQVAEFHSIAYDSNANVVIGGSQDNGTSESLREGVSEWRAVSGGDGGDVAVDDSIPGNSIRYSSFQFLAGFTARLVDSENEVFAQQFPELVNLSSSPFNTQFVTPIALNATGNGSILIGGSETLFVGFPTYAGESRLPIEFNVFGFSGFAARSIEFGGYLGDEPQPHVFYVVDGQRVVIRGSVGVEQISMSYPGTNPIDVTIDPHDWRRAAVLEGNGHVAITADAGRTGQSLDDLPEGEWQTIEFVTGPVGSVVAGGQPGLFQKYLGASGDWSDIGDSLPNAVVMDLEYDETDNVLAVGTLGRGAFLSANFALPPIVSQPRVGDRFFGGDGKDTLIGADGEDVLDGGFGHDQIEGREGRDFIYGGGGNDTLLGGRGNDVLLAQAGTDSVLAGEGDDYASGGSQNDTVLGEAGSDYLEGDDQGPENVDGRDFVYGDGLVANDLTDGNDTIFGGNGNDILTGGYGDDVIVGEGGRDLVDVADVRLNFGDDQVFGGDGNDTVRSGAGNDLLQGGNDDDVLESNGGQDVLFGEDGHDLLNAGDGNDFASGNLGRDTVNGGLGNDSLYGGLGNDLLAGDAGNDELFGEGGADSLDGGLGSDTLDAGAGVDEQLIVSGTFGAEAFVVSAATFNDLPALSVSTNGTAIDLLVVSAAAVLVQGLAGNDSVLVQDLSAVTLLTGFAIDLGAGSDRLDASGQLSATVAINVLGGDGNDSMIGGAGADLLNGQDGNDTISGGDGNDALLGRDGADSLVGGEGRDNLAGGDGNDRLQGDAGSDRLDGDAGDDVLDGGASEDLLIGAAGNDTLLGGTGADSLLGVGGNDLLDGGSGDDALNGGDGHDRLAGRSGNDRLSGEGGNDILNGGDGDDTVNGGSGNDLMGGGDGADLLSGVTGNDTISGGGANDTLFGGSGVDVLLGGDDDDEISGNDGADIISGGLGNDRLLGAGRREIQEATTLSNALLAALQALN